ncbi:MAG: T9SS C-terminal target domain-containing protein [Saprospiraceae bacterium]|nr:T9SS C-terminal target domain-containing protein [Saprospiraceae bacterium]
MVRSIVYILLFVVLPMAAQELPFSVKLNAVEINGMGGIQSFAFGQHDGKWLIAGGRLDGLHRRQPFASFDLAGHNNQLIVIDPIEKKFWKASLLGLPAEIQEQLSSTNMEFIQEGNMLYCLGGYGYSQLQQDHTTFAKITAIQVAETIKAISEGQPFDSYIRQYNEPIFQVCGGHLHKINDTYYLLGGQKFIGRYNPMGPDHGPGFIQEYTNEIRKFNLIDDGLNLNIEHLSAYKDVENLHRRDYNAKEQIMPDGTEGITMFSGVFRSDADLPYLNAVNVDASGYSVNDSFQQLFNHYHCATMPVYNAVNNEMHTVFFGGIAQYYMENGQIVKDDNVPFVKTIAGVTRHANGQMKEFVFPVTMPALLGAGSEFIPGQDVATYQNGVIKANELEKDTTTVGFIFGGISSSAPNIFFVNDGSQSVASTTIFEVQMIKNKTSTTQQPLQTNKTLYDLQLSPNPGSGSYQIKFKLRQSGSVDLKLQDLGGRLVDEKSNLPGISGENRLHYEVPGQLANGSYLLSVTCNDVTIHVKLVLSH